MRRRLAKGVRMYTGDDFNYAELIAGDDQGYSDALLGIFDAIAPAASGALSWRCRQTMARPSTTFSGRRCRCRGISSARRRASTRPAWCSWPISTAIRITSPWSAGRRARARRCISPRFSGSPMRRACCAIRSCATSTRMRAVLAVRGQSRPDRDARPLPKTITGSRSTPPPSASRPISSASSTPARGAASARSRRGAIRWRRSDWSARSRRCATPGWSCPAIAAAACSPPTPRIDQETLDDNRRAIDEAAALGSPCLVLVVGGLPQYSRPGSAPSKDIAPRMRR